MRVGIMIHVKGENDRRGYQRQRGAAADFCRSNNHEVVATYRLSGESEDDLLDHPDFQQFLEDIGTRYIEGLVIKSRSSFCRKIGRMSRLLVYVFT